MPPVRGKKGFVKKSELGRREKASAMMAARNEKTAAAKEFRKENLCRLIASGRRLIDIALFAEQMWCTVCDDSLSLRYLEVEKQRGLASIFSVRCHRCLANYDVHPDSVVKKPDGTGYPLYSSNCKAALACIDTGVGFETFNRIMDTLNAPTVSRTTLVRAQKRVSQAITSTAKESCQEAIMEERLLSLTQERSNGHEATSEDTSHPVTSVPCSPLSSGPCASPVGAEREVELTIKYDCGWQKRGHGHSYDSRSGHGSAIGQHTRKILAYGTKSKSCAMCTRGHDPSEHSYCRDWEGSSKAMEPAIAVDILLNNQQFKDCKVRLGTLVGDADSSTLAALQRESPHPIQKVLDMNHAIKSFSNALWKLKLKKHKFLTPDTINYLKTCFSYACAQNKGDPSATAAAIKNIVSHTFGEHSECNEVWCKGKDDPNYVFKSLPKGKAFSCPVWKVDFQMLLEYQAKKANQLAPGGSTQNNESFNHMVATRAPKSRHYSGTVANNLRVSAAVAWKNIGAVHMEKVFEKTQLSPSARKFRLKLQRERERKSNYQSQVEVKRRRLFLKKRNIWQESRRNQKEGVSYQSGMGTTMERAAAASTVTSWLPPHSVLHNSCVPVIIDIETTGLETTADIVQLSAKCNEQQLNLYMMPSSSFTAMATAVTGLRVYRGQLLYQDAAVNTTPSEEAAHIFLNWLQSCGPQVILVGHNILRFDAPRIFRWLNQYGLTPDVCQVLYGFTDTMPLLQQGKMKRQDLLAKTYLTSPEWQGLVNNAHNALTDCILLDGLLHHFQISEETIKKKSEPTRTFFEKMALNRKKKMNLPGLSVFSGHISKGMMAKMATHGITVEELRSEYEIHGRKGLEVCLGVQINGKPRVTRKTSIIDGVEACLLSVISATSR